MQEINNYIHQLENKDIVILGLAKEGLSSFQFLRKILQHKKIWLIDEKSLGQLDNDWKEIQKKDKNVEFSTHLDHSELENSQGIVIIKTPGIPPASKLLKQTENLKCTFTSNVDIFFALIEIINAKFENTEPQLQSQNQLDTNIDSEQSLKNQKVITIGVTGTKGKSTTSSVIHHVLSHAGFDSFLGGNIGIAPLSLVDKIIDEVQTKIDSQTIKPVFVVLELSCHQLNDITHSPNYAVVLDITPEHLDYYEDFNHYIQAKSHICLYQNESDFAIFDTDNYIPHKIAQLANSQNLTFNKKRNIHDNAIYFNDEKIVDIQDLALIGEHTVYNTLPSVVIGKNLGIANHVLADALKSFKALPHRLELVLQENEVSYYNDSLSTTPVATIAAIESFKNNPIILIAGGFDRGLDYSSLAQTIIQHQIKHLILFPDTGDIILEEIKKRLTNNMGELLVTHVTSMSQAVEEAKKSAEPGNIVLMSPASASFNLFKDYQDRGDQFIKYVNKIQIEK